MGLGTRGHSIFRSPTVRTRASAGCPGCAMERQHEGLQRSAAVSASDTEGGAAKLKCGDWNMNKFCGVCYVGNVVINSG